MGTEQVKFHIPESLMREYREVIGRLERPYRKGDYSKWLIKIIRDFIKDYYKQQQIAKNPQFVQQDRTIIRKTRELMTLIVKVSWTKGLVLNRGDKIKGSYILSLIKEIRHLNKRDDRQALTWFNRLIEFEFIHRTSTGISIGTNDSIYQILETGQDWGDFEPDKEQKHEEIPQQKEVTT